MCISVRAAEFSGTKIYAGEAERQGQYVHVLAYQNEAVGHGPNAMVLPIPSIEPMGPDNVVDTKKYPRFLNDIVDSTKIQRLGKSRSDARAVAGQYFSLEAQVFESGSYTIVLADRTGQIPEALKRVSEDRRPEVSTRFLLGFSKLYHNHKIMICCWNGNVKAEPMLCWYVPTDRDVLFIPTMDAHNGDAPNINAIVYTDHIVTVGSAIKPTAAGKVKIRYNDTVPEDIANLLPQSARGLGLPSSMLNGDCFVKTSMVGIDTLPLMTRGINKDHVVSSIRMEGWE